MMLKYYILINCRYSMQLFVFREIIVYSALYLFFLIYAYIYSIPL